MATVETTHGKVKGLEQDGLNTWFGIPFGAPPVGDLRFRRAQRVENWDGVRECTAFAPGPLQFGDMMGKDPDIMGPHSEDCLYLNVWAPQNAEGCPVFVYLYGGANHLGETADPSYRLDSFARKGIVAVSPAYRVGPLGFYDFSPFSDRFDSNCALSDVALALQWVRDNIERFGGDPSNVTLCGESAGGSLVYCALASPACKGLFRKAIAMSGLPGNAVSRRGQLYNHQLFFEKLGIEHSRVDELVDMGYEQLLEGALEVYKNSDARYPGIFQTGAVVGDDLLPDYVWDALAKGSADGVACLLGTCANEAALFRMMKMIPLDWAGIGRMFELNGMPEALDQVRSLYGGMKEKDAVTALVRDRMFWADAVKCALALSERGNRVHMYRYDFATTLQKLLGLGAAHASDIGPGLDTWEGALSIFNKLTSKKKLQRMHDVLHSAFVSFVRTGEPQVPGGPAWDAFEPDRRAVMALDQRCRMVDDPDRARFEFWKDIELYQ